jgi:predicted MFS family arabinose efflux permease
LDYGRFGFGSMLGSWLGGKLSDKIGFYKIMVLVYLPADYCSSRFNTYAHFGIVHRNVVIMTIAVSSRHVWF